MKRFIGILTLFGVLVFWVLSLQQIGGAVPGGVPAATYLGGEGSYTIDPSQNFIVKRRPFGFELVPGPDFTAGFKEQVWSSNAGEAPDAYHNTWADLGQVTAGCVVEYLIIDDDPDDRVNRFYINDAAVYETPQGMVVRGHFTAPSSGALRMFAEDSIGIWVEPCDSVVTATPTSTVITPTATITPTMTATSTISPTATVTSSPTAGPSLTPTATTVLTQTLTPTPTEPAQLTQTPTATATGTAQPSATPTATETPPVSTRVISPTPTATNEPEPLQTPSPTPTKEPRLNACLRINFEVGGDVARRGLYVVQEVGGRVLYSWWAEEGWEDSGWVRDIDITFPTVYVQVFYHPGDGSPPIEMVMLNPAPDTTYGWLARGQCHALEVAWPSDVPVEPGVTPVPPADETDAAGQLVVPAEDEDEGGGSGGMGGR